MLPSKQVPHIYEFVHRKPGHAPISRTTEIMRYICQAHTSQTPLNFIIVTYNPASPIFGYRSGVRLWHSVPRKQYNLAVIIADRGKRDLLRALLVNMPPYLKVTVKVFAPSEREAALRWFYPLKPVPLIIDRREIG